MTTLHAIVFASGLALLATSGDYFLKLASLDPRGPLNKWLLFGCGIYLIGAFGWIPVLRSLKLAVIGATYSVATVVFLATLGALVFDEALTRTEIAGIVFGVLSIALLART